MDDRGRLAVSAAAQWQDRVLGRVDMARPAVAAVAMDGTVGRRLIAKRADQLAERIGSPPDPQTARELARLAVADAIALLAIAAG